MEDVSEMLANAFCECDFCCLVGLGVGAVEGFFVTGDNDGVFDVGDPVVGADVGLFDGE